MDGFKDEEGQNLTGSNDEFFAEMDLGDADESEVVEDIIAKFDNEGQLRALADEKGKPKLPVGLPVPSGQNPVRRFRKLYVAPSFSPSELFGRSRAMPRVMGKRDAETMLCSKVQKLSTARKRPRRSSRIANNKAEFNLNDRIRNLWETKIGKIFKSGATTVSPKLALDSLKDIYTVHWEEMLTQPQETRISNFIELARGCLQSISGMFFTTLLHASSLNISIADWNAQLYRKIAEKNTVIDYWSVYKLCATATPPEFDESSNWGLKPLRNSLSIPYFKDWHMRIAAPQIFQKEPSTNLITTIMAMKKKWTVKDVAKLRQSILKTVLEKMLGEAKDLAGIMNSLLQNANATEATEGEETLKQVNQKTKTWEERNKERFKKPGRGRKASNNQRLPVKKKTTRTKKAEDETVVDHPGFEELPISLRACKNFSEVRNWLQKENKRISQLKYDQIFSENSIEDIDWNIVSAELMNRTKKLRVPEDCKSCFEHIANPAYENKRHWSTAEKNILKKYAANSLEWKNVSAHLPKPRPEFVVFYKWRKICKSAHKMVWTKELEDTLREVVKTSTWDKAAVEVNDYFATKKQIQERFKKALNPVLHFGKFTRVEDCLMMLTLEKLKGHFGREKHFGIMTAYLPWRYESAWRDRAENLFAEYIVPWTLEEDRMLLEFEKTMKRDWSQISKKFTSFKTRKGCLTRHKILEKRLKTGISLEDYHNSYAMIRYNTREYRHLKDISALLNEVMKVDPIEFHGFARDRPPTADELQNFLLSFDRVVMASAIRMIDTYIGKRDEFWTEWRKKNGVGPVQKRKTHDRRTFHPENTQSIASALHIRDVKLIPREKLTFKLTQREQEIYKFYGQFCSTKALKRDKPRPYIPLAAKLKGLPDVKRIVQKGG